VAYENFVNNERLSFTNGIKCPTRGIAWRIGGGSSFVYVGDVYHMASTKNATMPPQTAVHSAIILIHVKGNKLRIFEWKLFYEAR
jgi:hypothetical protein